MSGIHDTPRIREAMKDDAGARSFRIAEWLHLAAAPTFMAMALLTGIAGSGAAGHALSGGARRVVAGRHDRDVPSDGGLSCRSMVASGCRLPARGTTGSTCGEVRAACRHAGKRGRARVRNDQPRIWAIESRAPLLS